MTSRSLKLLGVAPSGRRAIYQCCHCGALTQFAHPAGQPLFFPQHTRGRRPIHAFSARGQRPRRGALALEERS